MFYLSFLKNYPNSRIVFLSGWGQQSNVINFNNVSNQIFCLDYLSLTSIDEVLIKLKLNNPEILIGWSLGGQIAINAILQKFCQPKLAILLATPFQFISKGPYQEGVDNKIYQEFYNNLSKDPKKLLKKFHLMMSQGDKRFSSLKKKIFHNNNFNNLQYWLDYLVNFSAFDLDFSDFCQTKLIYGKNDQIVNSNQGLLFYQHMPNSDLKIIDDYSHILF